MNPPPVANISGKKFLDAFFIRKVLLKAWPPTFTSFYAPDRLQQSAEGYIFKCAREQHCACEKLL